MHRKSVFTLLATSGLSIIGLSGGCSLDTTPDLTGAALYEYRVTAVDLPASTADSSALGLDLDAEEPDGDDSVDNKFGNVLAAMEGFEVGGFPAEIACNEQLATDVAWMLTVLVGEGGVGAALTRGVPGSSGLEPIPSDALPAVGHDLTEVLVGDGAMLPFGAITDPFQIAGVGFVHTVGLHARVDSFTPERVVMTVGVGLSAADVDGILLPNAAAYYTTCIAQGQPPSVADYLDRDDDGVVTVEELRASSAVKSMLSPDVTFDGAEALSFGLRITADAY